MVEPKSEDKSKKATSRLEKTAAESESIFLKTLMEDDATGDCKCLSNRHRADVDGVNL